MKRAPNLFRLQSILTVICLETLSIKFAEKTLHLFHENYQKLVISFSTIIDGH